MPKKKLSIGKLGASIAIDLIGMATYAVPVLGEVGDLLWSPISASLIYYLYGNAFFAVAGGLEELGPATDFIPTATLAWLYDATQK
jgi:hypothetical protein